MSVWWPGIGEELKNMIVNCTVCKQQSSAQRHEPLKTSTLPARPWAVVATDLFQYKQHMYLVIVDYYSRWIEIKGLISTTSNAVIKKLKEVFIIHGIPDLVHSDNGPQYVSSEFKSFAANWGFTHSTSSPHFHQANGEAERAVQTAKKILGLKDPELGLLNYRSTPTTPTNVSPAQALMGRQLRNRVPMLNSQLLPKMADPSSIYIADKEAKARYKRDYDRRHGVRELPHLEVGDPVQLRTEEESSWKKSGTIISADPDTRSYLVETPNSVLRRNRKHLLAMPDHTDQPVVLPMDTPPIDTPPTPVAAETPVRRSSRQTSKPKRLIEEF
jgi:transposase InsO family protein